MKKTLLFALALQLSGSVLAASPATTEDNGPKWYQADMIVFRYLDNNSGEAWPPVAQHPVRAGAVSLKNHQPKPSEPLSGNILEPVDSTATPIAPDLAREPFVSLPRNDFLLNTESGILSRSNRYEVISQVAWRMPVDDSIKEKPVKISASSSEGHRFLLSGSVTVSTSRYLHVDTNLWLNELAPEALFTEITGNNDTQRFGDVAEKGVRTGPMIRLNPQDAPLRITRNFQLKEKRRIKKSDEVQYLDSPVIGVLFKLTPYERPNTIIEISEEKKAASGHRMVATTSITNAAKTVSVP